MKKEIKSVLDQRKEKWEGVDGWGGWTLIMRGSAFVRVSKHRQIAPSAGWDTGFLSS